MKKEKLGNNEMKWKWSRKQNLPLKVAKAARTGRLKKKKTKITKKTKLAVHNEEKEYESNEQR